MPNDPKHVHRLRLTRNRQLLLRHEQGASTLELAAEYGAPPAWIRRLIEQERRLRAMQAELKRFSDVHAEWNGDPSDTDDRRP